MLEGFFALISARGGFPNYLVYNSYREQLVSVDTLCRGQLLTVQRKLLSLMVVVLIPTVRKNNYRAF